MMLFITRKILYSSTPLDSKAVFLFHLVLTQNPPPPPPHLKHICTFLFPDVWGGFYASWRLKEYFPALYLRVAFIKTIMGWNTLKPLNIPNYRLSCLFLLFNFTKLNFSNKGMLKLTDFGFALMEKEQPKATPSTSYYPTSEVFALQLRFICLQSFSYGLLLLELVGGRSSYIIVFSASHFASLLHLAPSALSPFHLPWWQRKYLWFFTHQQIMVYEVLTMEIIFHYSISLLLICTNQSFRPAKTCKRTFTEFDETGYLLI